jgi:S1-C subfamily serine protease
VTSLLTRLSNELQALISRAVPAVVGVEHPRGQGTGLVISQDGYVLTNAHVVAGASDLSVSLRSGGGTRAEIVGIDQRTDLAVMRIGGSGLATLPLADSRGVRVGQIVVAVGNPLRFDRSVSLGVISALDRTLPARRGAPFEGLIQTDAAINPGNSGGPLLDTEGAVVGINTAVIAFAQGIGFAVPARTASWVAAVLIRKGTIARPYLGIAARGEDLEPALALETGTARAVRVVEVGRATPAAAAGLLGGDRILAAQGEPIFGVDDLQRTLVLSNPEELRLTILRGRERRDLIVRPAAREIAA